MTSTASYIQVVLASPLRRSFDYLPAAGHRAEHYPVGSRVEVPFGRQKQIAIVIGHSEHSDVATSRLKAVGKLLDDTPLLSSELLALAEWMRDYYHHAHGETLFNLLPSALRKGANSVAYQQTYWEISARGLELDEGALARAPKQQALLNHLRETPQAISQHALQQAGHQRSSALQLEKKQLASASQRAYYPADSESLLTGSGDDTPPTLHPEQAQATAEVCANMEKFFVSLLEGITGSGKTEVYLRSIEAVLTQGRQAMVLIPEIGLTPQTLRRFVDRFAVPIAVFHSGLNDRERQAAWMAARSGHAKIVVGTRSAVFTPLADLGLIIIDEEHDNSYKQQDGLRYSARDVAIIRARRAAIPVLLGSATPSLETLHNARRGKYHHLQLQQRAGNATPPAIELLDIRRLPLHDGLSDCAIRAIRETLNEGQQAMVFINRRGFAPLLTCHDCGWQAQCQHCDAKLTLHQHGAQLRCHHCDLRSRAPSHCQRCQSSQLLPIGQGTEKTAATLSALFPHHPVLRIDRDTTQGKQAMGEKIADINRGQAAILVGTQMLAKGHHFPALRCVVILDVDQGLYHPDFRGAEKTLQLLTQVAGRAGRSDDRGRVIIQTHLPDHPLLQHWCQSGYQSVSRELLEERQSRQLPPFSHMAVVRADSRTPQRALNFLAALQQAGLGAAAADCQWLGPMAASMEKRAGRHRAQWLLYAARRGTLHRAVARIIDLIESQKKPADLRWNVDIDPQEVL